MRTTVVCIRGLTAEQMSDCVYVGRRMFRDKRPQVRAGSPFGNPKKTGTLEDYRKHVLASPELLALLPSLKGKRLGCWCVNDDRDPPCDPSEHVCHAQTLADLVDAWEFNPADFLHLAANSPEQLRECDVERVLTSCPEEYRAEMADWLDEVRPDLSTEVEEVFQELSLPPI